MYESLLHYMPKEAEEKDLPYLLCSSALATTSFHSQQIQSRTAQELYLCSIQSSGYVAFVAATLLPKSSAWSLSRVGN